MKDQTFSSTNLSPILLKTSDHFEQSFPKIALFSNF